MRGQRPVDLPRWVYLPALLGAAFVLLPLVAVVARVDWAHFLDLVTSEDSQAALVAEPSYLAREHPGLHRPRRADGDGAGPVGLPVPRRPPLVGPAPPRAATGRRRTRAALHLRPSRTPRRVARRARHPDRLLHHRRGDGPDLRGAAVPRGQRRGRTAHRRRSLRGRRRLARRVADHRASAGSRCRWCCRAWCPVRCSPSRGRWASSARPSRSPAASRAVTRTLPLEIYLQRETDPDAAVALALVLLVVAVVVIGFARQGTDARCEPSRSTSTDPGRDVEAAVEVGDGETLALLGPNGSGKSTLLGVLAGLVRPDHGLVVLDGRGADRRRPRPPGPDGRAPRPSYGPARPGRPALPAPRRRSRTSPSGLVAEARPAVRRARRPALARRGRRRRPRPPAARPALRRAGPAGRGRPGAGRRAAGAAARRADGRPRRRRAARDAPDAAARARRPHRHRGHPRPARRLAAGRPGRRAGVGPGRRGGPQQGRAGKAAQRVRGAPGRAQPGARHVAGRRRQVAGARGARPRRGRRPRRRRAGHRGLPAAGGGGLPRGRARQPAQHLPRHGVRRSSRAPT